MSDLENSDVQTLERLTLQLSMRSGDYCGARTGVTLVLFHGKRMQELVGTVARLFDLYLAAIPEGVICSAQSPSGQWREYSARRLATRLRLMGSEQADYENIHLSSGEMGSVGEYGFHFFGSDLTNFDIKPRECCCCVMEFPISALDVVNRGRFEEFVVAATDLEPVESGYAGYAFKHLSMTWREQAFPWISQKALRFLAVDIGNDDFAMAARRRVVNVSWITLLGDPLVKLLGGEDQIRARLSPAIRLRALASGLAIVAGEVPPIGDVNRGLHDIRWLKEVAALTKPERITMEMGFGSETFRRTWLHHLDGGEL